jgi:hypothetical protein
LVFKYRKRGRRTERPAAKGEILLKELELLAFLFIHACAAKKTTAAAKVLTALILPLMIPNTPGPAAISLNRNGSHSDKSATI